MNRPNLTKAENDFLSHMMMWGSNGYPVQKLAAGRWIWAEMWGVKGAPTTYKTKRAAVQAVENYIGILCDKAAGRI